MQHARRLIESRPFLSRIPDPSLIASDPGRGGDHVEATRDADGSYAFVYSASGKPFSVDLGKLSGKEIRGPWYDPRDGTSRAIGTFEREGVREFRPPRRARGTTGSSSSTTPPVASRPRAGPHEIDSCS